jgi:hypothetical protein
MIHLQVYLAGEILSAEACSVQADFDAINPQAVSERLLVTATESGVDV